MDIPPILAINLPERQDRWVSIQNVFQTWRQNIERVEAVKMDPGWKGCSLSHRKCIELAKQRGYPWVLIVEDDCLPTDGAYQRFRDLLPTLWARRSEWEIFSGGPSYLLGAKVVSRNPPLLDVVTYGTQFCLVHAGTYDKILKDVGDHLKIDVYYTESMKTWCTVPHLATQLPGKSDIDGKVTDHSDKFQVAEEILYKKLFLDEWDFIPKLVALTLVVTSLGFTLYCGKMGRK